MSMTLSPPGQIDAALQTPAAAASSALSPLLLSAAFAPLDSLGWIRVTGPDRVRWLNGMVTNSIQTLQPGRGCYNFVLNAQGRIQADLTAFLLDDSILLETARDRVPTLIALLDRFIIMDDVELEVLESSSLQCGSLESSSLESYARQVLAENLPNHQPAR